MKLFCPACNKVFTVEVPESASEFNCPQCASPLPVPQTPLSPGAVIGDFLLEKALSSGGMGVVYLARQISLDRPVALKVLHDKFSGNQEYIEGLFREARAAAKLTHPNIVQAYAVGEENGIFYFAMEYIRGETFKQILKKHSPLEFDQAIKVIKEICSALQVAWNEQKLVHQDIKPDNIMLDSNGFAKLADLGLARSANSESMQGEDETEVMGTPQYISPEQLTGVPTDVRSDIYSLGATFYQFLTGQFPYPEDSAEAMARKHVEGKLTPPMEINPEIPVELSNIVVKMMARNIEERYQMPSEVIEDLEAYADHRKSASIAVPKLNLNIGKKNAPGVTASKPGLPAKPAVPAKPGLPAKPAVPAKPGIPAKPAVPAKPAIPAKPAVPAQSAVPEKKADPVKPAEPEKTSESPAIAVPPVSSPAPEQPKQETAQPKKDEELTLAPKKEKPKPEETGEKAEEGKKKDGGKKAEKKKRSVERPSGSARTLVSIFLVLPLLLLILAAAAYFVGKIGKLKEPGKKYVAAVNKLLKIKSADEKSKDPAQQSASSAPSEAAAAAPSKPVPVTRPEFISGVDSLISMYRNDQANNAMKFLEGSDKLIARYSPPRTEEEKKAFASLRKVYAWLDEEKRANPAREKVIAAIARGAAEQQAALEKERLRIQQEKERKAIEEARQRKESAQAEARAQAALKENERLTKELKAETEKHYRKMAEGFLKSIRKNDPQFFQAAVNDAAALILLPPQTPEQTRLTADFQDFHKNFIPKAFKEFEAFYLLLKRVSPEVPLQVEWRGGLVDVIKIVPGKDITYRSSDGSTGGKLNMRNKRVRRDLFRMLEIKFQARNHVFYYEFLEGTLSKEAVSKLPNAGWQRHLIHFDPPIDLKGIWPPKIVKPVAKPVVKPVKKAAPAKKPVIQKKAVPAKKKAAPAKKKAAPAKKKAVTAPKAVAAKKK